MKKILTLFHALATIICLFLVWALLKLSTIQDISLRSVTPAPKHPEGVYLITYADGDEVFFRNQNALTVSAVNKGIDGIINFKRHHIDEAFYQANKAILDEKRGAGYWLWKPYFIHKALNQLPENAIVIYADSGNVIRKPVEELINIAKDSHAILIIDTLAEGVSNRHTTKRAVFKALNCDDERCHNSQHIWAGFIVLRNTTQTREFITTWLKWCTHKELINDDHGADEHPDFSHHQHDQSILTAVYALNTSHISLLRMDDLQKTVRWHHRHPNESQKSLISDMYIIPGIAKEIWRSNLVAWLREIASS